MFFNFLTHFLSAILSGFQWEWLSHRSSKLPDLTLALNPLALPSRLLFLLLYGISPVYRVRPLGEPWQNGAPIPQGVFGAQGCIEGV